MKRKVNIILIIIVLIVYIFRNNLDALVINSDNVLKAEIVSNLENNNLKEELNNIHSEINLEKINNEYTISKVKYRNVYNFLDEITIYKGSKDNLKEKDAVFNNEGLIGIITKTEENSSIVRLITNKETNISVKINESFGVLKANDSKLIVSNITNYENVEVGDKVYTSGIGHLIGNILIGTVSEITTDNLGIEKIITISPAVNFNKINYVYVVGAK